MNTLYIFNPCGHIDSISIEQLVEELAAQIKVVSADLEVSRAELILARIKADNCFKQAIKAAGANEINCDHATFDQRQLHLLQSDTEAILAADDFAFQMKAVQELSNRLHELSATHAAALSILKEQMTKENSHDEENTKCSRTPIWH